MVTTATAPDQGQARQEADQRNRSAMRAIASGNLAGAEADLLQAVAAAPDHLPAWLNLAGVRRQRGDIDAAFVAIHEVLTLDPRNFAALLMSATMLERQGLAVPAALAYRAALAHAPPDAALDPPTLRAVQRGREVQGAYVQQLDGHIREHLAPVESRCTAAERRRLEAFVKTTLRVERRYQQEPTEYFYPGLPAIGFYERAEFPWLEALEAATDDIGREVLALLAGQEGDDAPGARGHERLPLEQWREVNDVPGSRVHEFYRQGLPVQERCDRAPATMRAVTALPQARVALRSPCAMYSALQPQTRVPARTGTANYRLVVHLPLIAPDGCGLRVGSETRAWRAGESWVFDDTIEHEAWNSSDLPRYILACDVWSPRLSADERAAIAAVIAAADAFNGARPADTI
jgi:aspartyl/asparaginyl beta-hydroxylase (cupin superfamily)